MTLGVVTLAYLISPRFSAAALSEIDALRIQAKQFELQFEWDRACDLYEEILKLNRNLPEVRERYRECLRRANQVHRHHDSTYRKEVLSLKYELAWRLFERILHDLLDYSLDKHDLDPGRMFRKGLDELDHALADPYFCREHLRGKSPADTLAARNRIRKKWGQPITLTRQEALQQVRQVASFAERELELHQTTTLMEFTCGICYAVDDYTMYLSPGQLRALSDALKGEFVGVGLRLGAMNGRLLVAEVLANSPASDEGLFKDDLVLAIDKKPTNDLPVEIAQGLLMGENGTIVELMISTGTVVRTVTLKRRPVLVPSVLYQPNSGAIGHIKITTFQDTTVQEFDNALAQALREDIKALILDLRGNSGGMMDAAVEIAERFLPKNKVIVFTQQNGSKLKPTRSRNEQPIVLPLVVLVDGETASAAEVLAGALKGNGRARVVGQVTFGKGCSQEVMRLPTQGLLKEPPETGGFATGGLRITVERLFAPDDRKPYTGRGITPHRQVARLTLPESLGDNQVEEARQEAQRLLESIR